MRTKTALILVLAFSLLVAFSASPVFGQGRGPGGQAVSALGVAQVGGQTVFVHIWAVVPPGADANEVAAQALREQGARPFNSQEFSTTGLKWDQFSDASTTNDFVTQYYNPGSVNTRPEPTGINGELALTNTHATWTNVSTSKFAFSYGGTTTRCPSLVRECVGEQFFDGNNDVAWLDLSGCCTLGVTWYGTTTDEADVALNTEFDWATDGVNHFDVETVKLHENGHVAGLGHSDVTAAVMYKSYQGVRRVLHTDDINGISSLYPTSTSTTPTATSVSVDSITYALAGRFNKDLLITIALKDNLGNVVAGASVSIDVYRNGSFYGSGTGTTGTNGKVTFRASNAPSGCYHTDVTAVNASGLTFDGSEPANSFCK